MHLPPTASQRRSFRCRLLAWFRWHERKFPWRETLDPWAVLVAEMLLRQTFARKVVPVYEEFMRRWPTPGDLAMARTTSVRSLIRPLGLLYRAREMVGLAREIIARFEGDVPRSMEGLTSLAGIGDYAASAVLTFAHGEREPVLDRNVIRLLKRLFALSRPLRELAPSKTLRGLAKSLLPRKDPRRFNYALLDFTALVCSHYRAGCEGCILRRLCSAPGSV